MPNCARRLLPEPRDVGAHQSESLALINHVVALFPFEIFDRNSDSTLRQCVLSQSAGHQAHYRDRQRCYA
jgi:hypothetical protein